MGDFNQDARKRLDSILGKPDPDARIAALKAENAELRAQIESERKEYRDAANEGAKRSQEENAALEADVEKWRIAEGEAMLVVESQDLRLEKLQADLAEAQRERLNTVGICEEEVKDVRAENERLRKTLAVAYDREAESDDENARTIARLREALYKKRRNAEKKLPCHWTPDDDGIWEANCGGTFIFESDGPTENGFNFCPFCGKKILPHTGYGDDE